MSHEEGYKSIKEEAKSPGNRTTSHFHKLEVQIYLTKKVFKKTEQAKY